MSKPSSDPYSPRILGEDGILRFAAETWGLPTEDLFGDIEGVMSKLLEGGRAPDASDVSSPLAAFIVTRGVAVTVDRASVRPSHIQCLLAAIKREVGRELGPVGPISSWSIDPTCALTLWTHGWDEMGIMASRLWGDIVASNEIDQLDSTTTPSLYGNKLRLSGFISAVVASSVQAGTPILDLMAGTGILSRKLAARQPVWTNDANPYAALLSRCQGIDPNGLNAAEMIVTMREPYLRNQAELQRMLPDLLEEEALFLHGDLTAESLERYRVFGAFSALPTTDGMQPAFPARLATERYANVYFGINQCIEIDSLRAAIDAVNPAPSQARDLSLCALILACATCATGPHFAQPPRAHTLHSMRTIVERRARSVSWEFDLALGRLASRAPPRIPFQNATELDWRDALASFIEWQQGRPAAVYVDPPYSKLQYSRYYHVLNVLLAYDYPPVEGTGRYPPRRQRFSSRFEYQPSAAAREFADLFRDCADAGLSLILSYGDGGFVPIEVLARSMGALYDRVEIFTEELRHHSQGRALSGERSKVTEHVLVGLFR